MSDLKIVDLYEKSDTQTSENFINEIDSKVRIQTNYEKVTTDTEWLELMETTIPYLDNIYRNPNRFIVNEEEIVKIELARKITVESIKHLSKNTNFIQEIDKKTGDVRPAKILNINKEEDYDTYENRVIYTLIQNMKFFIFKRKQELEKVDGSSEKNDKKIDYNGTSTVKSEKISINISLESSLDDKKSKSQNEKKEILDRIQKLENRIADVTNSEVYKIIDKKHISLVTSPLKKTNVILKNVNFQYAIKLWNYIQANIDDKTKEIKDKKDYEETGEIRDLGNELFLIQYLISNKLTQTQEDEDDEETEESEIEKKNKLENNLTDSLIEKIVDLNSDLTAEQLNELIAAKYTVVKYKKYSALQEIQKIFKKYFDQYIEKI